MMPHTFTFAANNGAKSQRINTGSLQDRPGSYNANYDSFACVMCGRACVRQWKSHKFCSHECYSASLRIPLVDRFWAKVQKTSTCWLWMGSLDAHGYGQIAVDGWPVKTHRVAWMFVHGPITADQHVLHHCDTPRCCRVNDHLFLGDHDLNMKDAASKGRLSVARPKGRVLSAEAEADIHKLFARYPSKRLPIGLRGELAKQFGVSPQYISIIGRGHRVRPTEVK